MKFHLPDAVTTRFAKQVLVAQQNSPRILFVSGIALMGATVVTACRGTMRLEETLDEIRLDRETVEATATRNPEKFNEREIKKLNLYITGKGVAKIAKLYLPSIALGVAAVACLTGAHNQLSRRNAGLSAALAATERALDSYRGRVRESLGEDKEMSLWRGERTEKQAVLDEEGNETGATKKVKVGGGYSPYATMWGRDTSTEWDRRPEYNLSKLRTVQELMTLRLNHKGHVFLNEVFDELGLDRTVAGQIVGWKSLKEGGKDGIVDFGVTGIGPDDELRFLDFVTGREDHIMLDFNVDGNILPDGHWKKI